MRFTTREERDEVRHRMRVKIQENLEKEEYRRMVRSTKDEGIIVYRSDRINNIINGSLSSPLVRNNSEIKKKIKRFVNDRTTIMELARLNDNLYTLKEELAYIIKINSKPIDIEYDEADSTIDFGSTAKPGSLHARYEVEEIVKNKRGNWRKLRLALDRGLTDYHFILSMYKER